MSNPKRWLDDGVEGLDAERELLRAGLMMDPSPEQKDRVWTAMLPLIGPLGPGGGSGPGPGGGAGPSLTSGGAGSAAAGTVAGGVKAAFGVSMGGIVKSMLIGGASGLLLVGSYAAVVPLRPEAKPATNVVVDESTVNKPLRATSNNGGQAVPTDEDNRASDTEPSNKDSTEGHRTKALAPRSTDGDVPVTPQSQAVPGPISDQGTPGFGGNGELSAAERASQLREESRMLAEARELLRRGDSAGALRKLEEVRVKFPQGVLSQEREALGIEALAKSGQRQLASQRAKTFLQAYPLSPHAAKVQVFVQ